MNVEKPHRQTILVLTASILAGLIPVALLLSSNALSDLFHLGDLDNLSMRSVELTHGASPLNYPVPPLRLLPLGAVMAVLHPLGVSPMHVTLLYSITVEFVLIPLVLYSTVRELAGRRAAAVSVLALAALTHVFPPWHENTAFIMGFPMYAYGIPPFLLAMKHSGETPNYRRIGFYLGCVALIELVMAALAAAVIAATFLARREYRGLSIAAGTSMLVASPLLVYFWSWGELWFRMGSNRAVSGDLSLSLLEWGVLASGTLLLLVAVYLWQTAPRFRRIALKVPDVVIGAVAVTWTATLTVAMIDAFWYKILFAYMAKYSLFPAVGVVLAEGVQPPVWGRLREVWRSSY